MRTYSRFGVLCLTVAVLLVGTGGGHAVAQTDVCLSAQVDFYLKIEDVVGESRAVSVEEGCGDDNAMIAIAVSPGAAYPGRPAETIIITVGQCPTCVERPAGPRR